MKSTIGSKIRQLRLALDLSARELGEKIGVTESAIYAYEKGVANPPLDKIDALAVVFAITKSELLNETMQAENWKEEAYRTLERENQRMADMIEFMKTLIPRQSFLLPTRDKAQLRMPFYFSVNEMGQGGLTTAA